MADLAGDTNAQNCWRACCEEAAQFHIAEAPAFAVMDVDDPFACVPHPESSSPEACSPHLDPSLAEDMLDPIAEDVTANVLGTAASTFACASFCVWATVDVDVFYVQRPINGDGPDKRECY